METRKRVSICPTIDPDKYLEYSEKVRNEEWVLLYMDGVYLVFEEK